MQLLVIGEISGVGTSERDGREMIELNGLGRLRRIVSDKDRGCTRAVAERREGHIDDAIRADRDWCDPLTRSRARLDWLR